MIFKSFSHNAVHALFICRAVISMTYYGITYNVGRIGGNIYLNFLLSILVEFLGYSSCLVLSEKLGRRFVHCGCLIITGMACIGTIFTTLYASESMIPLILCCVLIHEIIYLKCLSTRHTRDINSILFS